MSFYFKVREICEIIQSGIQPLQNIGLLARLEYDKKKKIQWAQYWIQRGFTGKRLSKSHQANGPYEKFPVFTKIFACRSFGDITVLYSRAI